MVWRKESAAVLVAALAISVPAMASASADMAGNGDQGGGEVVPGIVFSMEAGAEAWSGDITYQIGYPVTDYWGYTYNGYFPFSELRFPLDVSFGVVKAEVTIIDKYTIGLKVKKSLNDPDDNMEDRDWITDNDPNQLDIYSESEVTDFDAKIYDVDVRYNFFRGDKVSFAAGIGYMYQDYRYETALIQQWSPSGYWGYDYVGDGSLSLIYEMDAEIPYIEVTGSVNPIPALAINARFAFAPWVKVDNTDQHLLRYKVNTGDLSGNATMFSLDARYDFTPYLFVNAGLEYTYIDVDGDMDATFYGYYDHTVAEELESNQSSLFATIGFRFGATGQQ